MDELFGNLWSNKIWVASQTSNNLNIPFNRKRNIWLGHFGGLGEVDQWDGIGKGWDQGSLEHEKEICSSSSPTRCSKTKTAAKTRKTAKKKKLRKPGCHTFLRTVGAVIDMKEGNIKFQFPLRKGMEHFPRKNIKLPFESVTRTSYFLEKT